MSTISISDNKQTLDVQLIHEYLTNSYWAEGRSLEEVQSSINNSYCYGVFQNDKQIGFARVISDLVVFAYILDVFIMPDERGKGYGQKLVNHIILDDIFVDVSQWYLKTKDAHELYEKSGFKNLKKPEWFMERII